MKKEHKINRLYNTEFKIHIIIGYAEVYQHCDVNNSVEAHNYSGRLRLRERIYLEEGETGLIAEKQERSYGSGIR